MNVTKTISVGSEGLELDLNTKELTFETSVVDRPFDNEGTLIIKNGTLTNDDPISYGVIDNKGTLSLTSVTIEDNGSNDGASNRNRNGGNVTLKDCILTCNSASGNQLFRNQEDGTNPTTTLDGCQFESASTRGYCVVNREGTIHVKNCDVKGKHGALSADGGTLIVDAIDENVFESDDYYGCYVSNTSANGTTVEINGGTFKGKTVDLMVVPPDGDNNGSLQKGNVKVTVNGGIFPHGIKLGNTANSKGYTWELIVKGGSFGSDPSAYVHKDYHASKEPGGNMWVVKKTPVIDADKPDGEI